MLTRPASRVRLQRGGTTSTIFLRRPVSREYSTLSSRPASQLCTSLTITSVEMPRLGPMISVTRSCTAWCCTALVSHYASHWEGFSAHAPALLLIMLSAGPVGINVWRRYYRNNPNVGGRPAELPTGAADAHSLQSEAGWVQHGLLLAAFIISGLAVSSRL